MEQSPEETLKQVKEVLTQLKAENDRREALKLLGGDSTASQAPATPKVETAKEYAARVMNNQVIRK